MVRLLNLKSFTLGWHVIGNFVVNDDLIIFSGNVSLVARRFDISSGRVFGAKNYFETTSSVPWFNDRMIMKSLNWSMFNWLLLAIFHWPKHIWPFVISLLIFCASFLLIVLKNIDHLVRYLCCWFIICCINRIFICFINST